MENNVPHESKSNTKYDPEIFEEDGELQNQGIMPIHLSRDMKTQASLIIKKCDGLPIAIVTIGSYLATRPKNSAEWKAVHDHLRSEINNNPDLGGVKTVLNSSYDGLPYHLKSCLLYLSVFHNHQELRRTRIIRRWMSDGYVIGYRDKTAEDVGKGYFYDLMGRSLIQPSQNARIINGDVHRCNIHDVMYKLILEKSMDEKVVSLLENENLETTTDKGRHLVIVGEESKGDGVMETLKLSHMRSLSIFGKMEHNLRYPRMKLLRVLDLEGTIDLDNQDIRKVGKLRHLKYLGLRGTKITKLPKSLRKLHELETLDVRNTLVRRLPEGLTELQNLSYLRSGFEPYNNLELWERLLMTWNIRVKEKLRSFLNITFSIDDIPSFGLRIPKGIRKLRSLITLGMVDIGESKGLVKEMQHLTNLRKLAVTGFSKKNGKVLANVIDRLKYLRSLILSAYDENDTGLSDCLEAVSFPPKYLHSLKLYSPIGKLPDWIRSLENLVKMELRYTCLENMEEIKKLEELPNLIVLRMLYKSLEEKQLCFGPGAFPKLQTLKIEYLGITSVSFEKSSMPRLESLEINGCCSLAQGGLSGLFFLLRLKEVLTRNEYDESPEQVELFQKMQALESQLRYAVAMHPNSPSLKAMKC